MIQTGAFDYINILDKAADASWLRHEVMSNNMANVSTPGYKRQDVAFESVLQKALGRGFENKMDFTVAKLNEDLSKLDPEPYTDLANFSYRLDKNNVDEETEGTMLAENQLKYQGLIDSMTVEFQNLKTVCK